MIVVRWILGVVWVLLAGGAGIIFVLYIASGSDHWGGLAKRLGRLVWALSLFWFNTEIWGRVVYTLVHWVR